MELPLRRVHHFRTTETPQRSSKKVQEAQQSKRSRDHVRVKHVQKDVTVWLRQHVFDRLHGWMGRRAQEERQARLDLERARC